MSLLLFEERSTHLPDTKILSVPDPALSNKKRSKGLFKLKVQKKAVKMISGLDQSLTYEEKCAQIGLDTLEARRRKQDVTQVFKILNGIDKVDAANHYRMLGDRQMTTRATGDARNLTVPNARLETRKNSFFVRSTEMWNALDDRARHAVTIRGFKNTIK